MASNLDKKVWTATIENKKLVIREFVNSKRRAYIKLLNKTNSTISEVFKELSTKIGDPNDTEKINSMMELLKAKSEEMEDTSIKLDKELFEFILDDQFDETWYESLSFGQMEEIVKETNKLIGIDFETKKGIAMLPMVMELMSRTTES